ncbi:DUF3592 domain-containing protein (plasmid) [Isosphaeraceae bacterium EP7]
MGTTILRIVMVAFGVAILIVGLTRARRSFRLARSGIRTVAVVVASEGDVDTVPEIDVEFEGRISGERHRARLTSGSGGPPVGELIEVLYDPDEPGVACGSSLSQMWFCPVCFTGLGMIIVLAACFGEPGSG